MRFGPFGRIYFFNELLIPDFVVGVMFFNIMPVPTIANAICDRLIHNAYKFELEGDIMRKKVKKFNRMNGNNVCFQLL